MTPDVHEQYDSPPPMEHESAEALALANAAEKMERNRELEKEKDRDKNVARHLAGHGGSRFSTRGGRPIHCRRGR